MSDGVLLADLFTPDTGLGLRKDAVTVVPHNQRWAQVYGDVAELVIAALGDLAGGVEHIGSTSVAGLAAKPVLDIAVGARQPIDPSTFIDPLRTLGFDFEADLGIYGGLFFTASSAPGMAVAHLHVVDIDDFQWRWYLSFRDGLRSNPELAATYATLKREAASANQTDRDGYTQAKFDWVLRTVNDLDDESTQ